MVQLVKWCHHFRFRFNRARTPSIPYPVPVLAPNLVFPRAVAPPFPFPVQLGLKRPLFHIRFRFWRKFRHFHVQWRHHFRFRCSKARGPSAVSGIPVSGFPVSGFRRRERDQNTDLQTQRVGKGGQIPLQLPTALKTVTPSLWVGLVGSIAGSEESCPCNIGICNCSNNSPMPR